MKQLLLSYTIWLCEIHLLEIWDFTKQWWRTEAQAVFTPWLDEIPSPELIRRSGVPQVRAILSSGQSLRHHLTIHDGDVDEEEQDDKEIIHEAQQADHTFWD